MSAPNERSLDLGEGRRRWGVHVGNNSGGWIAHNAVVDADVQGVLHRRGYTHHWELVEGRDLGVHHAAGRGAKG